MKKVHELLEEIQNTPFQKIEIPVLSIELVKLLNITQRSLKKVNLETLKNSFDKCQKCNRDAVYLNKESNQILCWNHSI